MWMPPNINVKIIMWMSVSVLACFALCVLSIWIIFWFLLALKVIYEHVNTWYCFVEIAYICQSHPISKLELHYAEYEHFGCWQANNPWAWPCTAEIWYKFVFVFHLEHMAFFAPDKRKTPKWMRHLPHPSSLISL